MDALDAQARHIAGMGVGTPADQAQLFIEREFGEQLFDLLLEGVRGVLFHSVMQNFVGMSDIGHQASDQRPGT